MPSLHSEPCCISEFRPEATGEMQPDPVHSWELCSIYNARCTRLSSWINLTGMNASHWGYNMGGNGRVMSALLSHPGRMHQKMSARGKLQHQPQIQWMKMKLHISLLLWVCVLTICICQRDIVDAAEKLLTFFQPVVHRKLGSSTVWSIS